MATQRLAGTLADGIIYTLLNLNQRVGDIYEWLFYLKTSLAVSPDLIMSGLCFIEITLPVSDFIFFMTNDVGMHKLSWGRKFFTHFNDPANFIYWLCLGNQILDGIKS
jgi:hypothetical protein